MTDDMSGRPAGSRDDAEVARFNRLAQDWWNPEGPMKPLHRLNPVRISFLRRELLAHFGRDGAAIAPFRGLSVLDIGCGAGLVAEPLARMGFDVQGLDLAEDNIAVARAHAEANELAITYAAIAIEDMPVAEAFDAITLLEVIEHVPDPAFLVREAAKRLKPGGFLIGSTLNRTLKSYAMAIIGAEYLLRWLPAGTHDWNRFVTPEEFSRLCEEAGLIVTGQEGMVFDPLSWTWRLSGDCDVNYLITARKPA